MLLANRGAGPERNGSLTPQRVHPAISLRMLMLRDPEARALLHNNAGQLVISATSPPHGSGDEQELQSQEEQDRLLAERLEIEWVLETAIEAERAFTSPSLVTTAPRTNEQTEVAASQDNEEQVDQGRDAQSAEEVAEEDSVLADEELLQPEASAFPQNDDPQADAPLDTEDTNAPHVQQIGVQTDPPAEIENKSEGLQEWTAELEARRVELQEQETALNLRRHKLEEVKQKLQAEEAAVATLSEAGSVPSEFICPITHDIMKDPVLAMDGNSYERWAVDRW